MKLINMKLTQQEKDWGFTNRGNKGVELFRKLPLTPAWVSLNVLSKMINLTLEQARQVVIGLPPNAPVAENGQFYNRIK